MADKTFKSIVHALRLSGINIPKNALLPSQLPAPVSSSEEEDMDGTEEEDGHDRDEEHAHDSEEDAESKIIGMPMVMERMKCTVIVDHLCWTQADRANRVQPFRWHRGARTSECLSI
jgi:hypothetical protein